MRYSPTVIDHFTQPRNAGRLPEANAKGVAGTPGQGNYVILFLRVEDDRIAAASFETFGCPGAIASGSITTELIMGKTVQEVAEIDAAVILEALDGLPPGRTHCAGLAATALKNALENHSVSTSRPGEQE